MSGAFPLSLLDFFGGLVVHVGRFELGEAMEIAETAGGEILASATGNRLWRGSIETPVENARQQAAAAARLAQLRQPGASFYLFDSAMRYPAGDPTGSILSGASLTVTGFVSGTDRGFIVGGVPSGYAVAVGDHVSISFGASLERRAYFVVTADKAEIGGEITILCEPGVPSAISIGDPVSLLRPTIKALVVPGSFRGGERFDGPMARGLRFDWIQTLR